MTLKEHPLNVKSRFPRLFSFAYVGMKQGERCRFATTELGEKVPMSGADYKRNS